MGAAAGLPAAPWAAALAHWGREADTLVPLTMGHINLTARVEGPAGTAVLQRLNPIFAAAVHLDIEGITAHLERHDHPTPRLLRTRDGRLWATLADGSVWRLWRHVPGQVWLRSPSPQVAEAAGAALGALHRCLASYPLPLVAPRRLAHDPPRHLAGLRAALDAGGGHPAHAEVERLGGAIAAHLAALPPWSEGPQRLVHGDPKLSNLVFVPAPGRPTWVDLDTLGRMPLVAELGDALRSWCADAGEDDDPSRPPAFDPALMRAALAGWRAAAPAAVGAEELQHLGTAMPTIALELSARFAKDALEERYFAWDRERFQAAWEHHLLRARHQLALAESYLAQPAGVAAALADR